MGTNREDCRERTRERREIEGEIRPNRMRHKTPCFMPSPQVSLPSKLHVQADKGVRRVCRSSPQSWPGMQKRTDERPQDMTSGVPRWPTAQNNTTSCTGWCQRFHASCFICFGKGYDAHWRCPGLGNSFSLLQPFIIFLWIPFKIFPGCWFEPGVKGENMKLRGTEARKVKPER